MTHKHLPKHLHKHNPKLPDPPKQANRWLGRDYGPYVDYDKIEGMKFVESLRGKYPNSTFWVIGTDPNIDLYPDNFFDDKLSITLNFACIGFPNSTYFLSSHTAVAKAIVDKLGSDCLNKCIFIALSREYRDPRSNIWWEDWGLDPIYAKGLRKHMNKQDNEDRERMIKQLSNEGPFELIANRAVNHAIQVAVLFGAKKIILVGCSNKGGDFYYHAQRRGMSKFYRDKEWGSSKLEMFRTGRAAAVVGKRQETLVVVRLFKKYNLEIVRHRFNEEKDEFIFEEIKLDE